MLLYQSPLLCSSCAVLLPITITITLGLMNHWLGCSLFFCRACPCLTRFRTGLVLVMPCPQQPTTHTAKPLFSHGELQDQTPRNINRIQKPGLWSSSEPDRGPQEEPGQRNEERGGAGPRRTTEPSPKAESPFWLRAHHLYKALGGQGKLQNRAN
jgi:hypothetical protein